METRQSDGAGVGISSEFDARSLLDHLPGMAYRCRWNGDWTMEFVSRGSLRLIGRPPDDLIENVRISWSQLIHSEDLPEVVKKVRFAWKERQPYQMEYRLALPDGQEKWVIEEGRIVSARSEFPCHIEGYVADVTEQKGYAADAIRRQQQAHLTLDNTHDAFVAIDASGRIRDWNRQAEAMFGCSRKEAVGFEAENFVPPEYREAFRRNFQQFLDTQIKHMTFKNVDLFALRPNGEKFPVELTVWPDSKGQERFLNGFVQDLSERRALEEQLAEAERALRRVEKQDPLTGLPNRQVLEDHLARALSFAKRWRQPLTLVMVSLDGFGDINRRFGRSVGDKLLVAFSDILASACRKEDLATRFMGGEFALMQPNTDLRQARAFVDRLRQNLENAELPIPGTQTITVGLATLVREDNVGSFIDRVDQALSRAREKGPNATEVWKSNAPIQQAG